MAKQKQQKPSSIQKARNRSHVGQTINNWDPKDLAAALARYDAQQLPDWDPNEPKWSIRRIAREFKVPYATLYKRITGEVEGTEHASGGKGRSRILSKKVEDQLEEMIEEYSLLGFPFIRDEIREIAYEFAVDNRLKGFSSDKQIAGRKWMDLFMERHPRLSIKDGTNLSLSRALASTKEVVNNWFDKYESVIDQCSITDPHYIWNVDETGTEDIPKKKKVIGLKKIKQFNTVPREKPKRTTMLTFVNAAGVALPPMVIHSGKYHDSWRQNCPRAVMVRSSQKGYINKQLFAEYGKRLIYHLHAAGQLDKPNLILMDSHYAHVFNYCFMHMMFVRDIKVMSLEAHSSHWSQPLDKNPFSQFKLEFNNQMRKFNRSVSGRTMRKEEYFLVFNVAWEKGVTKRSIQAGFKRTGIWPVDRTAIPIENQRPGDIRKDGGGDVAAAAAPPPAPAQAPQVAEGGDDDDAQWEDIEEGGGDLDELLSTVPVKKPRGRGRASKVKSPPSRQKRFTRKVPPAARPKRKAAETVSRPEEEDEEEVIEVEEPEPLEPVGPQLPQVVEIEEVQPIDPDKAAQIALRDKRKLQGLLSALKSQTQTLQDTSEQFKIDEERQRQRGLPVRRSRRSAPPPQRLDTSVTKRKAESTAAPPAPVKRKKIIVTPVDFDFQPETTTTTLAVDVHRPYGDEGQTRSTRSTRARATATATASASAAAVQPEPAGEESQDSAIKVKQFYKKAIEKSQEVLKAEKAEKAREEIRKTLGVRPGPVKKSIKDYFKKPELKKPPVKRATIMSKMPTSVFTDPECLEMIRKRDKDKNNDYCKEYEEELREITPQKKVAPK